MYRYEATNDVPWHDCHWTIAWWRCVQSTAWNACFNRMWQHKCIRVNSQKAGVPLRSSPTQTCALPWWCLVIRSVTTTNGSKDVLGSYAHCTETTRRYGQSSVQTVLQQECTHLQFAANQRCSQVPCRTSKLPGLHLAQFNGSGTSYAKSTWSWLGCDWRSHIHSLDGPAACTKGTLAIHQLHLPQRSLCRRQVFLPKECYVVHWCLWLSWVQQHSGHWSNRKRFEWRGWRLN